MTFIRTGRQWTPQWRISSWRNKVAPWRVCFLPARPLRKAGENQNMPQQNYLIGCKKNYSPVQENKAHKPWKWGVVSWKTFMTHKWQVNLLTLHQWGNAKPVITFIITLEKSDRLSGLRLPPLPMRIVKGHQTVLQMKNLCSNRQDRLKETFNRIRSALMWLIDIAALAIIVFPLNFHLRQVTNPN